MDNIICPKCGAKIRVANSLIEPLIQARVQRSMANLQKRAKIEAEAEASLTLREKELQLAGLRQQIETLRQQALQGSQQLQGEAQERELEALLEEAFPRDIFQAVPKGRTGADLLHRVTNAGDQAVGTILWEIKRTRNWSPAWLSKLREDQRRIKAEMAVLASHALPGELYSFELMKGVWVTHPRYAVPLAMALRHLLIEVSSARKASSTPAAVGERLYRYVSSNAFRQHVERVAEQFATMKNDLERERTAATRMWAKREAQIQKAMESTVALYAQLQSTAETQVTEIRADFDAPRICVRTA